MVTLLNLFINYSYYWEEVKDFTWSDYKTYYTLKKMYPEKWYYDIEKNEFSKLLKKIDVTDRISIALSFIKIFDIKLFLSPIDIDYNENFILLDDFSEILYENCLDELPHEDNVIIINKCLKRKKFIRILEENYLIDLFNDVYNNIKKYINDKA